MEELLDGVRREREEGRERREEKVRGLVCCRGGMLEGVRCEVIGNGAFTDHWERVIREGGGVTVRRLFTESER